MKRLTLGDVCKKESSNIAQKNLQDKKGAYPIYGASGLIKQVDFYQQDKEYIAVVKDGAGIGRTMLLPAYSSVIGTMQYLLPKEGIPIDIKYLFYAVEHMNLAKYFSGATIPHIYFRDYQKEPINIPDIETQRKISQIFGKIDALITSRKEQRTKLDQIVKSRFIEMFGEPDENPMGWEVTELEHQLEIVGGFAFKSTGFTDSGIPVLRIGNINSGHFLSVNMVFWPNDPTLARYKMYPGDLVMSLTGTVGKDDYGNVCILSDEYPEYYLNQRNAKLVIKTTMNKHYLSELLKFSKIKKRLTGISRGVRQANISNRDILALCVPIPPIKLQEQFADFVEQTDKSKLAIQKSLEKLEILKKSLMQKYFG